MKVFYKNNPVLREKKEINIHSNNVVNQDTISKCSKNSYVGKSAQMMQKSKRNQSAKSRSSVSKSIQNGSQLKVYYPHQYFQYAGYQTGDQMSRSKKSEDQKSHFSSRLPERFNEPL